MGLLDRLERFIQGVVEGGTNSVLRPELSPLEIEAKLTQAMRDASRPSQGGRLAPNSFVVWLHPKTLEDTLASAEGYNRRCELLLNNYAHAQGFILLHPRITVVFDADSSLRSREIHIESEFEAPVPVKRSSSGQPLRSTVGQTEVISAPRAPETSISPGWIMTIIHGADSPASVTIPTGTVTVGRSDDCEIVLQDAENTVSRQHAMLTNTNGELRIQDVGSKNGTQVNGNFIAPHVSTKLTDGAEIAFGGCVVQVHVSGGEF